MAARNPCHYHSHGSNMAPSSGRLLMSIISPYAGKGADFVFQQSGAPFPARGLIILVTRCPKPGPYLNCGCGATSLWRKDDEDYFSSKLHMCINNSPHGKFHRFLFPFSSKFSDLNFTSNVLYIYLYYVTCHTVSLGYLWLYLKEATVIYGFYLLTARLPELTWKL